MNADFVTEMVEAVQKKGPIDISDFSSEALLPLAAVPEGYTLESLEKHLTEPVRVKQSVVLLTPADFCAYFERFSDEASVVFADERNATYLALIDYHEKDNTPHWNSHSARYQCPKSPEWTIWLGANGKKMTQADFAQFIEDNYIDITDPPHADMIEISHTLEARKDVSFGSSTRLTDGQVQFKYTENISGMAGAAGTMKIPEAFHLAIPVYLGGPLSGLKARLRYRIDNTGKLAMWYDLHRPEKVVESATRDITSTIREKLTTAPIFLGSPS
jgi:uncharacterized protein YfdQ (DUF2303 family)